MSAQQITFKLAHDTPYGRAGQIVTLALQPADVHEKSVMPTYLAGYTNAAMRADEASKIVLVDKDTDKVRNFDSDDAFALVDVKGSISSSIPEVDPASSLSEYKVKDRFVGSFINDITEQNADSPYRPRQVALRRCGRAIQMDREVDWWTLISLAATWNANNVVTLGATAKWNGGSASAPIQDIQARLEKSAQPITDAWMNQTVANALVNHASVQSWTKLWVGDAGWSGTAQQIANAGAKGVVDFTLPGIACMFHVVCGKYKNVSTGALNYILGNHVVFTTSPPGIPSDGEEIATSYTFRRKGTASVGFETREFRVEGRGPKGGTMVVAYEASDILITSSISGGLIRNAVQ